MAFPISGWSPAETFASLKAVYGDRLSVERDESGVRWTCDGRSVVAVAGEGQRVEARFIDRPLLDAVAGTPAVPVYRAAHGMGYALSRRGCALMAADMSAFFAGVREPQFVFSAAATVTPLP